jgi:VanZ like family
LNLADYPGLWLGIAVSLVVSLALCIPVGRALGIAVANAWLLVFSLGIIFSATLTPSLEATSYGALGTGRCDLSRFTPLSLGQLLAFDEYSLNVLLFVPLGIAIGCILRDRYQSTLAVAAVALPFAIEWIQLVVVQLDRACQSGDVVDNLLGLTIGLIAGSLVAGVWRAIARVRSGRRRPGVPPA